MTPLSEEVTEQVHEVRCRSSRGKAVSHAVGAGIEGCRELGRLTHQAREIPDAVGHTGRLHLADGGEDLNAELGLAHGIGNALHDARADRSADDDLRIQIPPAVLPAGRRASVVNELLVTDRRQIGTRGPALLGERDQVVTNGLVRAAEDGAHGCGKRGRALLVIVARVMDIGRHRRVLSEEGDVDRLGAGARHAIAEDTTHRHLVEEVATPAAVGLRLAPQELALLEGAHVDPPPRGARHDALLPGEGPVEWGERIGADLVGVAARVQRKALALLGVGDPALHGNSLCR